MKLLEEFIKEVKGHSTRRKITVFVLFPVGIALVGSALISHNPSLEALGFITWGGAIAFFENKDIRKAFLIFFFITAIIAIFLDPLLAGHIDPVLGTHTVYVFKESFILNGSILLLFYLSYFLTRAGIRTEAKYRVKG